MGRAIEVIYGTGVEGGAVEPGRSTLTALTPVQFSSTVTLHGQPLADADREALVQRFALPPLVVHCRFAVPLGESVYLTTGAEPLDHLVVTTLAEENQSLRALLRRIWNDVTLPPELALQAAVAKEGWR